MPALEQCLPVLHTPVTSLPGLRLHKVWVSALVRSQAHPKAEGPTALSSLSYSAAQFEILIPERETRGEAGPQPRDLRPERWGDTWHPRGSRWVAVGFVEAI